MIDQRIFWIVVHNFGKSDPVTPPLSKDRSNRLAKLDRIITSSQFLSNSLPPTNMTITQSIFYKCLRVHTMACLLLSDPPFVIIIMSPFSKNDFILN